ncbi:MAG: TIGR01440 family protein [Lachnospiraceae bacterium]|nr:TIGR01440 family protein [Lachnospiraceae bacterium]
MDKSTLTTENFKEQIYNQAKQATNEVIKEAKLDVGDILVVGCSSSEIIGETIGQASSIDVAQATFAGIYDALKANGIYIAAQCCEHLNRAIIIEKELALRERMEIVNVVPQPKAGGSFATTAYKTFANPVAVEHIKADAGMDIGDTLIGMHLKDVAVPLRISINSIGEAHLVCARTRAKFIGGERACYDEGLA